MEKTLFLLIGSTGAGTRVLHENLSRSREALKKTGILYRGMPDMHNGIGNREKNHAMQEGDRRNTGFPLKALTDELQRGGWHTGIISIPYPAGDGDAALFRKLVPEDIPVKVVYYAMRQDELAESLYSHSVESPGCRYGGNLDDDLVNNLTGLLDHAAVIRPWAEMFGKDTIVLRCYEAGQMGGGIPEDFAGVIGLQPGGSVWTPAEKPDAKLSVYHTEFLRICNVHKKNNPEIHRFLRYQFQRSRLYKDQPRQYLLSPAKRREILERYENSNQATARAYLNRADGRLFSTPWPAPDEPWEPFTGLHADELAPIITELIHEQEASWERPKQPLGIILGITNTLLKKVPGMAAPGTRGAATQQECRGVPSGPGAGPAYPVQPDPQGPRTVEDLVSGVAERMYHRNRQMQERQPLATGLAIVNHFLARVVARVPDRTKKRIETRIAQGWFFHE